MEELLIAEGFKKQPSQIPGVDCYFAKANIYDIYGDIFFYSNDITTMVVKCKYGMSYTTVEPETRIKKQAQSQLLKIWRNHFFQNA